MAKKMRFMEQIRQKGRAGLMAFLIVFLVSVFAGIGVGAFSFGSCSGERSAVQQQDGSERLLVNEGPLAKHSMLVNGEPVAQAELGEAYLASTQQIRYYMQDTSSSSTVLLAFSQAANSLVYQRVMLQKADELGLKVSGAEIKEKRNEVVASVLDVPAEGESSLLGDIAKSAEQARASNEAFTAYLQQVGLTKDRWEMQVRNQLLVDKTREALQAEKDEVARAEALEKRAEIDERLAAGESFADLATEFSDEMSAGEGGLIDSWLPRGLFLDPTSEEICFSTPVGEMTPWIDLVEEPQGVQRYEIVEEQFLEGEQLADKRDEFITAIREKKGDPAYEPTDEELRDWARQIKVRQLVLYFTSPNAASDQARELVAAAEVQINDIYVLAGQALYDNKIQPPAGFDADRLMEIAANSPHLTDYDRSLLELKLENGKPQAPGSEEDAAVETSAPADAETAGEETTGTDDSGTTADEAEAAEGTTPEAEETADTLADTAIEAEADDPADADSVLDMLEEKHGAVQTTATENEYAPVYPLVIGLLKAGIEAEGEQAGPWVYFMIGKLALDWLEDEEQLLYQLLDRDQARLLAEENLARALEGMEYDETAYALRGLNLAWLGKNTGNETQLAEAATMLTSALDLAPYVSAAPIYETIREAYDVLEDEDGIAALEIQLTEIRQEEAANQPQNTAGQPMQFDLGDIEIPESSEAEPVGE